MTFQFTQNKAPKTPVATLGIDWTLLSQDKEKNASILEVNLVLSTPTAIYSTKDKHGNFLGRDFVTNLSDFAERRPQVKTIKSTVIVVDHNVQGSFDVFLDAELELEMTLGGSYVKKITTNTVAKLPIITKEVKSFDWWV